MLMPGRAAATPTKARRVPEVRILWEEERKRGRRGIDALSAGAEDAQKLGSTKHERTAVYILVSLRTNKQQDLRLPRI